MLFGRRRGFTLIEIMVVIAIILIVAAFLMPVIFNARKKAQQVSCLSSIRQLAISEAGGRLLSDKANLACPAGGQYAHNKDVTDLQFVSDTSGTVLYFESANGGEGSVKEVVRLHMGGANFAFCDGHAKWSVETPNFRP
jgi:prepilin-type N-terminal cleavage/methylation domain-containing protein/prepilin-type processing-associated H-X9-DG protein